MLSVMGSESTVGQDLWQCCYPIDKTLGESQAASMECSPRSLCFSVISAILISYRSANLPLEIYTIYTIQLERLQLPKPLACEVLLWFLKTKHIYTHIQVFYMWSGKNVASTFALSTVSYNSFWEWWYIPFWSCFQKDVVVWWKSSPDWDGTLWVNNMCCMYKIFGA